MNETSKINQGGFTQAVEEFVKEVDTENSTPKRIEDISECFKMKKLESFVVDEISEKEEVKKEIITEIMETK
jgi:ubiquinone biosynthesis protein Coq4